MPSKFWLKNNKQFPSQWPFQDPKLEVPPIYKAYFLGHSISGNLPPKYGQTYATFTYLHLLDPEDLPFRPNQYG